MNTKSPASREKGTFNIGSAGPPSNPKHGISTDQRGEERILARHASSPNWKGLNIRDIGWWFSLTADWVHVLSRVRLNISWYIRVLTVPSACYDKILNIITGESGKIYSGTDVDVLLKEVVSAREM
jgi:hypothetical protein